MLWLFDSVPSQEVAAASTALHVSVFVGSGNGATAYKTRPCVGVCSSFLAGSWKVRGWFLAVWKKKGGGRRWRGGEAITQSDGPGKRHTLLCIKLPTQPFRGSFNNYIINVAYFGCLKITLTQIPTECFYMPYRSYKYELLKRLIVRSQRMTKHYWLHNGLIIYLHRCQSVKLLELNSCRRWPSVNGILLYVGVCLQCMQKSGCLSTRVCVCTLLVFCVFFTACRAMQCRCVNSRSPLH